MHSEKHWKNEMIKQYQQTLYSNSKHHKAMLFSNPDLKNYFEEPPMRSLRQGLNLRKYICTSNLAKLTRSRNLKRGAQISAPAWMEKVL